MARLPNFLVIIRSEKLSGKGQGRGCLGVRKKERFVLGKRTFRSQKSKHFVLRIIKTTVDELCHYKGIGPAKAITILAASELGKRRKEEEGKERKVILSSRDVYQYFYPLMCDLPTEECWVLLLNQASKVIDRIKISSGGLVSTAVDVRCILREALLKRAVAMALCHNHPSGSMRPSTEDDRLTEHLDKAAKVMNIRLIDHVILTDGKFYSYADEGKI